MIIVERLLSQSKNVKSSNLKINFAFDKTNRRVFISRSTNDEKKQTKNNRTAHK